LKHAVESTIVTSLVARRSSLVLVAFVKVQEKKSIAATRVANLPPNRLSHLIGTFILD
jgi:hypothetical protein